jgi:hypothetical protein
MYDMYRYGQEPESEPENSEALAAVQASLDRRDNGGDPNTASKVAAWQQ